MCGSGKTEIILKVVQYVLNCGEKVAFALPRRDVCIEINNRLKEIFIKNTIACVYGGHTKRKIADIVVLTTHQLYRYKRYFNLIILDEIDAFPFKDDPVLNSMFFGALNGHYIMMSATPPKELINYFSKEGKDILKLDIRFHRHPLPVPNIRSNNTIFLFLILLKELRRFIKEKKPVFIFAPTIEECEKLYRYISLFIRGGNYVHSKRINRSEIINSFRLGAYKYLVTTSVLERGVTVRNLQVIIHKSDSFVYDSGTLVQISGRVGRKKDAPEGEVIFLANKITKEMRDAVSEIEDKNKSLQDVF